MKPYDGGAWVGVSQVNNNAELQAAYDASGTRLMHLQKAVLPHDPFVRCLGLGPQLRSINYDPGAPLHDRYRDDKGFLDSEQEAFLHDMTLTINSFFGWDFNVFRKRVPFGKRQKIAFAKQGLYRQFEVLLRFLWQNTGIIFSRQNLFCALASRQSMHIQLNTRELC